MMYLLIPFEAIGAVFGVMFWGMRSGFYATIRRLDYEATND